jgi:hypothetical protein
MIDGRIIMRYRRKIKFAIKDGVNGYVGSKDGDCGLG